MSPILMSPPSRPSIGVLIACASTGSALTAKPAAMQAATKPRRSTCTSGSRLFSSLFPRSRFIVSSDGGSDRRDYACKRGLFRRGWTPLPDAGRLLEGVRQLQHAEVVAVTADDLDADGQALGRKACRHRNRGMARRRDEVAALHPVDIVVQLHAGDFGRILLLDRERRHLVHRAHQELVALEERAQTVKYLRAQLIAARHLLAGQLQSLLDVPHHRVLQLGTTLPE